MIFKKGIDMKKTYIEPESTQYVIKLQDMCTLSVPKDPGTGSGGDEDGDDSDKAKEVVFGFEDDWED